MGHDASKATGFAFDNESPRHTVWLAPFALASRPVSNAEWLDFIRDGGYRQPALCLSDGWAQVQAQGWRAPAGWLARAGDGSAGEGYTQFTLHGEQPVDAAAPVCHLSGYEAAAFAAWAGARLPTEFEWEHGASAQAAPGPVRADGRLCPVAEALPAGHARHSYRNFFPAAARWQFSGLRLARDAG